ncbi:uridine kinase-like 4 [Actinidia rufa]|uniref:Uridine kinase-like 4 n=1 Tax=Actinidia rufa TaxID=165716 RepID=A0A7J0FL12_9ERIC|nr:uridine kinase-like 4 [Actinidia rufa]
MRGVAFTLHQVIKFATLEVRKTLYGDQVAAKQCYLATISTKATMKEVQLIEKEREFLEDVGRDPEAKVVEDLIHYELEEPSSDRFFLIEQGCLASAHKGEESSEAKSAEFQLVPEDHEAIRESPQNAKTTVTGGIFKVPEAQIGGKQLTGISVTVKLRTRRRSTSSSHHLGRTPPPSYHYEARSVALHRSSVEIPPNTGIVQWCNRPGVWTRSNGRRRSQSMSGEKKVGSPTHRMGFNSKSVVDLIEASSGVHFSGLHLDGLEPRNSEVEQPTTSAAEHMHKQPFVIGVAGGAASGKKAVCDMIIEQLHDQRVVLVTQVSHSSFR